MRELRFAPWHKHEKVVLVEKDGESWLVGKGPWPLVDIFSKQQDGAWLPSRYELSRGFRTTPPTRTVPTAEGEQKVIPLSRNTIAAAFASIEMPEQALEFANRFGLLGLHTVKGDNRPCYPSHEEMFVRVGRGVLLRTSPLPNWHYSIPKPGSEGEYIPFIEAGSVLLLSGPDLRKAATFIKANLRKELKVPIFLPEAVSEWLEIAATLRCAFEIFRRREAATPPEDAQTRRFLAREEILRAPDTGNIDKWTQGSFRVEDGELVIKYSSLRNAIFQQAHLEMNGIEQLPRRCANPNCGRWFVSTIKNAKYCTEECKRHCQNQRNYERRSKKPKTTEARQEGK